MLRHIVALTMMFFATSLWASENDATRLPESLLQENAEESCYCDVRKRQQVKIRLQKQKTQQQE